MVDCIRVYGKAKDVFGWPEHPPEPIAPAKSSTSTSTSPSSALASMSEAEKGRAEVAPLISRKPLSPMDLLVCYAFCVLGNHCISVDKSKVGG